MGGAREVNDGEGRERWETVNASKIERKDNDEKTKGNTRRKRTDL